MSRDPSFCESSLNNSAEITNTSDAPVVSGAMSLRDWFAGHALSGISTVFFGGGGKSDFPEAARRAYEMADAMLATREAGQ
ncbi:TPA: hypothetical protein O5T86_001280 [Staphylococcus aureus]|nr:hypothetical protein [Staphylococcus aureus]HDA7217735.1 hypothetical protein [Staphylococcus aureus]HDA7235033.1 hypothetical protein [Staphylococcus aureus]HDA7236817.1 hypothetical protein [Staphylococcus aureus]HDA7239243.1 hypothetical protein [Staphylococcus aureus]